jgi:hypothetical protein
LDTSLRLLGQLFQHIRQPRHEPSASEHVGRRRRGDDGLDLLGLEKLEQVARRGQHLGG